MRREEIAWLERALQDVPEGTVAVEFRNGTAPDGELGIQPLPAGPKGRGKMELYEVYPGVHGSFCQFQGCGASFCHRVNARALNLFYCRAGRVGWNTAAGTAVYLGAGELSLHGMDGCAASEWSFPAGYAAGIALWVDLARLEEACPEILRCAGFRTAVLEERFCGQRPLVLPASQELEWIFAPLYAAPPELRLAYLRLKLQELLLYLGALPADGRELTQDISRQTEAVRAIHSLLTTHLERRYTIEELSKEYFINTCALKEIFKAVYGQPIATYMKEYRVRRAMTLLRETDESVASIAAQVGYETQGKFTKAFKDVAQILPTEYRRNCRT